MHLLPFFEHKLNRNIHLCFHYTKIGSHSQANSSQYKHPELEHTSEHDTVEASDPPSRQDLLFGITCPFIQFTHLLIVCLETDDTIVELVLEPLHLLVVDTVDSVKCHHFFSITTVYLPSDHSLVLTIVYPACTHSRDTRRTYGRVPDMIFCGLFVIGQSLTVIWRTVQLGIQTVSIPDLFVYSRLCFSRRDLILAVAEAREKNRPSTGPEPIASPYGFISRSTTA